MCHGSHRKRKHNNITYGLKVIRSLSILFVHIKSKVEVMKKYEVKGYSMHNHN